MVTRPSYTYVIIRFSLSKDSFSSDFIWSYKFTNFVSKYFLKSVSFLILESVSASSFFSKLMSSYLVLKLSCSVFSNFIFSILFLSSSDWLKIPRYSSLWSFILTIRSPLMLWDKAYRF